MACPVQFQMRASALILSLGHDPGSARLEHHGEGGRATEECP